MGSYLVCALSWSLLSGGRDQRGTSLGISVLGWAMVQLLLVSDGTRRPCEACEPHRRQGPCFSLPIEGQPEKGTYPATRPAADPAGAGRGTVSWRRFEGSRLLPLFYTHEALIAMPRPAPCRFLHYVFYPLIASPACLPAPPALTPP